MAVTRNTLRRDWHELIGSNRSFEAGLIEQLVPVISLLVLNTINEAETNLSINPLAPIVYICLTAASITANPDNHLNKAGHHPNRETLVRPLFSLLFIFQL
jgi:hypothetical protein